MVSTHIKSIMTVLRFDWWLDIIVSTSELVFLHFCNLPFSNPNLVMAIELVATDASCVSERNDSKFQTVWAERV